MSINIIMPTFNRPEQAYNVIKSFDKQTMQKYIMIVVDDGSEEENYLKLKTLIDELNNNKIIFIRNHINSGIPVALNKAFDYCTNTYTTWISDDNDYHVDFLEVLITTIQPNNKYAYASHIVVNKIESKNRIVSRKYKDVNDLLKNFAGIVAFIWDTEFMKNEIGKYNEMINGIEDFDYHIRTFIKTKKIGFTNKRIVTYYRTYDSLFHKQRQMISKRRVELINMYSKYLKIKDKITDNILVYLISNKINTNTFKLHTNSTFTILVTENNICTYDECNNIFHINYDYYSSLISLLQGNCIELYNYI